MHGRQQPETRLDQDDPGTPGVRHPEIARNDINCQFLDGSCQLHAGRASAHDDESQVGCPLVRIGLDFSDLERQQHAGADERGVFHLFHARGEAVPLGMTKVVIHGPGGQEEIVVRYPAVADLEGVLLQVDP